MGSTKKRSILGIGVNGVIWVESDTLNGPLRITFPGPLEAELWEGVAGLTHPQIGRVSPLIGGYEQGASVECLPRSGSIDDDPKIDSTSELGDFLRRAGIASSDLIWLRRFDQSNRGAFFICVPQNMGSVPGWEPLGKVSNAVGRELELRKTRRLPIHKRARFRFGAFVVVTCCTVALLGVLWAIRISNSDASVCPSTETVQTEVTDLLVRRADALERGDLEALQQLESSQLYQLDRAVLNEKKLRSEPVVAPDYDVQIHQVFCEEQQVVVEGTIETRCEHCVQDPVERKVTLGLDLARSKILSFNGD